MTPVTDPEMIEMMSDQCSEVYSENIFNECKTCGYIEWAESIGGQNASPQYFTRPFHADITGRMCPRCNDVYRRAPEIFNWVTNCLRTHRRKLHPDKP